jgi:hypothetical protein
MKTIVYINMRNNRVIRDKQDDRDDNVVKYLISFLSRRYFVEYEEKL